MSDVTFIKIKVSAASIADSAQAAYWDDSREVFHDVNIRQNFAELAELLGYQIEKLPPKAEASDLDGEALA